MRRPFLLRRRRLGGRRNGPAMRRFVAAFTVLVLAVPVASRAEQATGGWVDPMIGTLGAGFVFPGPAAPYGMVQLSPDTEGIFAYTGYQWIDRTIRGFSHVRAQSMGVPEGGNLPFMPTLGDVQTDVLAYQTPFSHATEKATSGYYRVGLASGITAELTAGTRVGMHRYTFPRGRTGNVLLDIGRQIPGGRQIPSGPGDDLTQSIPGTNVASITIVDAQTITGTANADVPGGAHGYPVHFVARFDRPFDDSGVWDARGAAPQAGSSVTGRGAGAFARFNTSSDADVVVKVGISFVSVANAALNLDAELPGDGFDFDGLRARTRSDWEDALDAITVEGGTLDQRIAFRTALYHAQHHPNLFSDVNGQYLGHDGAVHWAPHPYYTNFSLWDTYRGEMQLLALIAPERFKDMMRSLSLMATQGGRLPRWALMNRNPDYMVGEPALITLADAYCRDLVPADVSDALYAAARKVVFDAPRDAARVTLGFVPGNPSATLEHALGSFAFALIADRLGYTEDRDVALARASQWRNVFDPSTRFMRPRNADGSWQGNPYLPESPDGWVEGTGWQYTWLVPHDIDGLYDAMGAPPEQGESTVLSRLDTFFAYPLTSTVPLVMPEVQQKITAYGIAYAGNQYAPSNEHDLQAPYAYNWTSQPWKTQALTRAYQGLFRAAPDGLPGNDDLGSMSAWFVWSALGFYPSVAGAPIFTIGSPLFESAAIRVPGGQVRIESPGALTGKYVASMTVNGVPSAKTWLTGDDLQAGDVIRFAMSPVPALTRVTEPPPSLTRNGLSSFAC